MTVTQSITTKDGVVWYVVDGKGQKHIYVKSQFESCFTISQDVLVKWVSDPRKSVLVIIVDTVTP